MQTTSFPVHAIALLTPNNEDVASGAELPKGELRFSWGLRQLVDDELVLTAPMATFAAQGIDADQLITVGEAMAEEGRRLKALESGLSIIEGAEQTSRILAGDLAGSPS